MKLILIVCGNDTIDLKRCNDSIDMQRDVPSPDIYWSLDREQQFLVRNTWETVLRAAPADDDILVFLDADDHLCDEHALRIVTDTYADNPDCLLTYGSYVNLSSNKRGKFTGAYAPDESVRTATWRASHLKTCKYRLWKYLRPEWLQFPDGTWFTCAADRAFMIPLMEMAGWDRCKHIDWLLYCYDDTNPDSVWKTRRDESIRTRDFISLQPALRRLETV